MQNALRQYLQEWFYTNNMRKYHKYFELWFKNLTANQLYYFNLDMEKFLIYGNQD